MVKAISVTNTAEIRIATANEPSAALTWLSSVRAFIRANRAPISAPIPTSAMPRSQGGRPPSTRPMPCRMLDPIMAPNIQLAGKLIARSSSATATEAAISSASSTGEATTVASVGGDDGAMPVRASSIGNAAVRMITRMVCTTAIAGMSAPFSIASMVICDSAPGHPARNAEVWSQPWTRCR